MQSTLISAKTASTVYIVVCGASVQHDSDASEALREIHVKMFPTGVSAIFDQVFTKRTLDQIATEGSFTDPTMAAHAGYVQVVPAAGTGGFHQLSGQNPTRLVLPPVENQFPPQWDAFRSVPSSFFRIAHCVRLRKYLKWLSNGLHITHTDRCCSLNSCAWYFMSVGHSFVWKFWYPYALKLSTAHSLVSNCLCCCVEFEEESMCTVLTIRCVTRS